MSNYYRPRGFGGFSLFPPVIKNLLIITGVAFFFQIMMQNIVIDGMNGESFLYHWFALNPLGYNFQVWQLITYLFMHGGFSHILFNMFALWMFGMEIENIWGSKKFLTFYLLCGVVAGIFQLVLPPLFGAPPAPTIGASGAVYGVLIAFGMLFPDRYIYIYFLVPVKAKYLIGFLIILEFLLFNPAGSIARLAHIGGAIAGFLFIMFDRSIDSPVKSKLMGRGYYSGSSSGGTFSSFAEKFKRKKDDIPEAKYYDLNEKNEEDEISQEEIDRILDKISQSGYQNLTEREKKILFEASKKMK